VRLRFCQCQSGLLDPPSQPRAPSFLFVLSPFCPLNAEPPYAATYIPPFPLDRERRPAFTRHFSGNTSATFHRVLPWVMRSFFLFTLFLFLLWAWHLLSRLIFVFLKCPFFSPSHTRARLFCATYPAFHFSTLLPRPKADWIYRPGHDCISLLSTFFCVFLHPFDMDILHGEHA